MPVPAHARGRATVNRSALRDAGAFPGFTELATATDAELDAALATVDVDALYDEERTPQTVEVWDKTSPINGVPAATILERDDMPDDDSDVYLILTNGVVTMIQPHEPEAPGLVRIPKGGGLSRGKQHADTIAAERARGRAVQAAAKAVRDKRAGKPAGAGQQ